MCRFSWSIFPVLSFSPFLFRTISCFLSSYGFHEDKKTCFGVCLRNLLHIPTMRQEFILFSSVGANRRNEREKSNSIENKNENRIEFMRSFFIAVFVCIDICLFSCFLHFCIVKKTKCFKENLLCGHVYVVICENCGHPQ